MNRSLAATFWTLSATLLVTRLLFIGTTMVIDDEAYYLMYARHLDWGYIDHGPVVGYLIRLFTTFFGENDFGIRVAAVFMLTTLGLILYRFGERHFSAGTGVALSLTAVTSFFMHMNGVIITPDAPLAFFAFLAIMMYYRAFFEDRKHFPLAGFLLGLAMLSKISAVFPALGIALFPVVSSKHRVLLKEKRFYTSFVIAFLVFVPFVIWNFQNDLAFFRYQGFHVARAGSIKSFLELWAGLLLVVGPVAFFYATVRPFGFILKRGLAPAEQRKLFFSLVAVVPLIYFLIHSWFSRLELNWVAPALFGGLFLFGITVGESWTRKYKLFWFQIGYSVVAVAVITLHTYLGILPLKAKNDITSRYYHYNAFKQDLTNLLDHPDAAGLRFAANNYQIPSMLNLYQRQEQEAVCLSIGYHETLYGFHHPDETLVGEDFLFLTKGETFPPVLSSHFETYTLLGGLESKRRGKIVRTFSLWRVDNYRGRTSPPP